MFFARSALLPTATLRLFTSINLFFVLPTIIHTKAAFPIAVDNWRDRTFTKLLMITTTTTTSSSAVTDRGRRGTTNDGANGLSGTVHGVGVSVKTAQSVF